MSEPQTPYSPPLPEIKPITVVYKIRVSPLLYKHGWTWTLLDSDTGGAFWSVVVSGHAFTKRGALRKGWRARARKRIKPIERDA